MDLTKREIFRKVDNNELTAFLDADYMNIIYKTSYTGRSQLHSRCRSFGS